MQNFTELDAWKAAREFYKHIYAAADQMPKEEKYGLAAQMKRSAVAISVSIAEGQGRGTYRDYVRYLYMAKSSAQAVEALLIAASDLDFLDKNALRSLYKENASLVNAISSLIATIQAKIPKKTSKGSYKGSFREEEEPYGAEAAEEIMEDMEE